MTTRIGRIVLWDDDEVTDSSWMPLIVFLARAKDEADVYTPMLLHLDFRDFMLMNGVERRPRPFLYVYKHVDSRRHLTVDADGSPYRFLPTGKHGQFRPTSFSSAVGALDPWFIRDAKRSQRCGVEPSYEYGAYGDDDREWAPPPDDADDPCPPVTRRLRLVR